MHSFHGQEVVLRDSENMYLHVSTQSRKMVNLTNASVFRLEVSKKVYTLKHVPSLECNQEQSDMSLDVWDPEQPELILFVSNDNNNQKFNISRRDMSIYSADGEYLTVGESQLFVKFLSRLRIMSFNIQECLNRSFGNLPWNKRASIRNFDQYESGKDILKLIDTINPHVICLQEFSHPGCKDIEIDRSQSCNADPGWRGVLQNPIVTNDITVKLDGQQDGLDDDRCFTYVGVNVPVFGNILVINFHVTYRAELQASNVRSLIKFVKAQSLLGTNMILCGDFNFNHTSPLYRMITKHLVPLVRPYGIDHVFASTILTKHVNTGTCNTLASDHNPIMVEFRYAASKTQFHHSHHHNDFTLST